jgi:hypothetical protein
VDRNAAVARVRIVDRDETAEQRRHLPNRAHDEWHERMSVLVEAQLNGVNRLECFLLLRKSGLMTTTVALLA